VVQGRRMTSYPSLRTDLKNAGKPHVYTHKVNVTHTACQAVPARADVSTGQYFLANLLLPLARSLAVQTCVPRHHHAT
jgi:hypothetical protein